MEYVALVFFLTVLVSFLSGFPVALCLGGVSVVFGLLYFGPDYFYLLPLRIHGISSNFILVAVPLFIFMGIALEKSGLAGKMLLSISSLMGNSRSGLAVAVILVGTLLAASTGVVGATVVTMGVISLPTMLKSGYHPSVASGAILASGTLGQIIPPSIVLVLLGSVLNVSVGQLFKSALVPSIILVIGYIGYIQLRSWFEPQKFSHLQLPVKTINQPTFRELALSFIAPLVLIFLVLGSIISGIASPTEAAGIGALGSTILLLCVRNTSLRVKFRQIQESSAQTAKITSMVFLILIGAQAFAIVFRGLGGEQLLIGLIEGSTLGPKAFVLLILGLTFIAGFFIDFIEIIFILIPVIFPILQLLEINLVWFGILVAINLQASFLTPPFGFSLFYFKGVSPPEITTKDIYRGVLPYILIQLFVLSVLFCYPQLLNLLAL